MGLYDDWGIRQPDHILNQHKINPTHTELREKYPERSIISLTYTYQLFWKYVRQAKHLECLPPPLIVDNTKNYPKGKTEIGEPVWCPAFFNTSHAYTNWEDVGDTRYPLTLDIVNYEIRVYTRALTRDINFRFLRHGRCSDMLVILHCVHIMSHEMCHFLTALDHQNTAYDTKDEVERKKFIHEWYRSIDFQTNEDQLREECENESMAIDLTSDFLYDCFDDDIRMRAHGPMFEFLKRSGQFTLYRLAALFIEYIQVNWDIDYNPKCKNRDELKIYREDLVQEMTSKEYAGKKSTFILAE